MQRAAERLVARPLFWVALLAIPFGWSICRVALAPLPPSLPIFEQLADFRLSDQAGREVNLSALAGRVWVASFLATVSAPEDQVSVEGMAQLQYRTRNLEPAAFAQLTFVGEGSPAALADYARRHRVSPRAWHLVAPTPSALAATAARVVEAAQGGPLSPVDRKKLEHGTTGLLVDRRGRVRGAYDCALDSGREALLRDLAQLLQRGGG